VQVTPESRQSGESRSTSHTCALTGPTNAAIGPGNRRWTQASEPTCAVMPCGKDLAVPARGGRALLHTMSGPRTEGSDAPRVRPASVRAEPPVRGMGSFAFFSRHVSSLRHTLSTFLVCRKVLSALHAHTPVRIAGSAPHHLAALLHRQRSTRRCYPDVLSR